MKQKERVKEMKQKLEQKNGAKRWSKKGVDKELAVNERQMKSTREHTIRSKSYLIIVILLLLLLSLFSYCMLPIYCSYLVI